MFVTKLNTKIAITKPGKIAQLKNLINRQTLKK